MLQVKHPCYCLLSPFPTPELPLLAVIFSTLPIPLSLDKKKGGAYIHSPITRGCRTMAPTPTQCRHICCLTTSVCGTDQVSLTWLWQGGNLGLASTRENTATVYSCSTLQWAWVEKVTADPELPLLASRMDHPWWFW